MSEAENDTQYGSFKIPSENMRAFSRNLDVLCEAMSKFAANEKLSSEERIILKSFHVGGLALCFENELPTEELLDKYLTDETILALNQ